MSLKIFFATGSGLLLSFLTLACGLPETVPQIKTPGINPISASIYTLNSQDTKNDGSAFTIYGLNFYYKFYKRSDGATRFETDFKLVQAYVGDPKTYLLQQGFQQMVRKSNEGTPDTNLPSFSIGSNLPWYVTIDFATGGSKNHIDMILGQTMGSGSSEFYRFLLPNAIKPFSVSELDSSQDSDLSLLKNDPAYASTTLCFGVIAYVFAQDFEYSYLPLNSAPVKLGTFDLY